MTNLHNLQIHSVIIPLTQGKVALVDPEDYNLIVSYGRWFFRRYAVKSSYIKKRGTIFMHRVILNATDSSIHIDHINGDKLDNRRSNIRICTSRQNSCNRPPSNSKKFKGVYKQSTGKKFYAKVKINNETIYLGNFDTQEKAAMAYNKAAMQYFGEFAWLNPI